MWISRLLCLGKEGKGIEQCMLAGCSVLGRREEELSSIRQQAVVFGGGERGN